MSALCRAIVACRLCGNERLHAVLTLPPTPPANAFVSEAQLGEVQEVYPLDVVMCEQCCGVQLRHTVDPSLLFKNYVYVSGTSPSFVRHFEAAAEAIIKRYGLRPDDLVVEVGSNDGTGLRPYLKRGMRVQGVDPALTIAIEASRSGVETAPDFFNENLASTITDVRGKAKVVLANNVFAHADDLGDILRGVRRLLRPDGAFVFEVQYLKSMLEFGHWDNCYHEHLMYWGVRPLRSFLERNGFTLQHVEDVDTHGGSIRCHAYPSALANVLTDPSVDEHIRAEDRERIYSWSTWKDFEVRIRDEGERIRAELDKYESAVAYGAPAKLTTFAYKMGVYDYLRYVVDDSPMKQGLYTPGKHLAVKAPDVLYSDGPDGWPQCILVTAWNFAGPILEKHKRLAEAGCRFIVPFERGQA